MENKVVMENNEVVVVFKDGSKKQIDKLIGFDDEGTGKSYIIYTDNSTDEQGNIRITASIVKEPNNPNSELEEIKSDREWKIIDTVLRSTMDNIRKRMVEKGEVEGKPEGETE